MKKKTTKASHFAVCINNEGYKASLEIGKLYRVIPDEEAASHGYVRVFDESGEDYLYSAKRFLPVNLPVNLPERVKRSIMRKVRESTILAKVGSRVSTQ